MSGLLAIALSGGAAASAKAVKMFRRRTVFCVSHFVIGIFLAMAGWFVHKHHGLAAFICIWMA